jgi:glutamyl-tRNA synthetase
MNGQYIAQLPVDRLLDLARPFLLNAGLLGATDPPTKEWLYRLLELLRPRAKRLTDFGDLARPFLHDAVTYEPEALDKHLAAPDIGDHLSALAAALRTVEPFDEAHVEATVRGTATERGIKAGALIHAARVALTGRTTSPGIFEVLVLLGRERSVERLERLVTHLTARTS